MINLTVNHKSRFVAIDLPLTIPKRSAKRKADREMLKHGYPVFPPIMAQ